VVDSRISLMNSESVVRSCDVPGSTLSVLLEDDGRVAYAYLRDGNRIVADVWLYNVAETPERVDWRDRTQMPFLNPKAFCKSDASMRITPQSQVRCTSHGELFDIEVDGRLIARLGRETRPGWSRLAAKAGPLAKPLEVP